MSKAKTVTIEFPGGTEVVVMHNNKPAKTSIRVASYTSSQEKPGEPPAERLVYSTMLDPNKALSGDQIGLTEEDLKRKMFGETKPNKIS